MCTLILLKIQDIDFDQLNCLNLTIFCWNSNYHPSPVVSFKFNIFFQFSSIAHIELKVQPTAPGYAFVEVRFILLLLLFFVFTFNKLDIITNLFFQVYRKCVMFIVLGTT